MEIVYKILAYIKKSLDKIKLIDKCLIVFMMLLMIQSTYNLFVNEANSNGGTNIDILIRTTEASIFGYFLSANFIKKDKRSRMNNSSIKEEQLRVNENKDITREKKNDNSSNEVEAIKNNYIQSTDNEYYLEEEGDENTTSEQQVIIVTVIGVVSLIAIIIARDFNINTTASAATISQLRDFVSGSVGFLLGCPTKTNK